MNQAWAIYKQTFRSLFGHFSDLLKLTLPTIATLFLMIMGLLLVAINLSDPWNSVFMVLAVVASVAWLLAFFALSVKIHRYFLHGERDLTWKPFQFRWGKGLGYFGYAFLAQLLGTLAYIAVVLLFFVVGLIGDLLPQPLLIVLVAIIYATAIFALYWITLRLSMILPAYSIETGEYFGMMWDKTKPYGKLIAKIILVGLLLVVGFYAVAVAIVWLVMLIPNIDMLARNVFLILIFMFFNIALIISMWLFGVILLTEIYRALFLSKTEGDTPATV